MELDNDALVSNGNISYLVVTMRVLKGWMMMMILWLVPISLGDNYAINHIC